jgi:hypothetical protein
MPSGIGTNSRIVERLRGSDKYKLKPTPEPERVLAEVLWRCRTLDNMAREQRISLYRQRGVSISRYSQEAELKDLRVEMPEYAAIHSPMGCRMCWPGWTRPIKPSSAAS